MNVATENRGICVSGGVLDTPWGVSHPQLIPAASLGLGGAEQHPAKLGQAPRAQRESPDVLLSASGNGFNLCFD